MRSRAASPRAPGPLPRRFGLPGGGSGAGRAPARPSPPSYLGVAPGAAVGGNFLSTPAESAELAFRTSAFSLKEVSAALGRLLPLGLLVLAVGGGVLMSMRNRRVDGR